MTDKTPLMLNYKWKIVTFHIDEKGSVQHDYHFSEMKARDEKHINRMTASYLLEYKHFSICDSTGRSIIDVNSCDWGYYDHIVYSPKRGEQPLPDIRGELHRYERQDATKSYKSVELTWDSESSIWIREQM